MDKELIKTFVQECKQEQEWKARYKTSHIEMCDYFKYSGEVEEYKEEYKWEKNRPKPKEIVSDNPIVNFYFKNYHYTIKEIAREMKIGEGTIRATLSNYFNNKKLEHGKNVKNGECK